MSIRAALIALSLGRVAIGAALAAAPRATGERWIGETANDVRVAIITRGLGARDLAIGAGTALALHSGSEGAARSWLAASAIADACDFTAMLTTRDRVPRQSAAATLALAGGAAVAFSAGAALLSD